LPWRLVETIGTNYVTKEKAQSILVVAVNYVKVHIGYCFQILKNHAANGEFNFTNSFNLNSTKKHVFGQTKVEIIVVNLCFAC